MLNWSEHSFVSLFALMTHLSSISDNYGRERSAQIAVVSAAAAAGWPGIGVRSDDLDSHDASDPSFRS